MKCGNCGTRLEGQTAPKVSTRTVRTAEVAIFYCPSCEVAFAAATIKVAK